MSQLVWKNELSMSVNNINWTLHRLSKAAPPRTVQCSVKSASYQLRSDWSTQGPHLSYLPLGNASIQQQSCFDSICQCHGRLWCPLERPIDSLLFKTFTQIWAMAEHPPRGSFSLLGLSIHSRVGSILKRPASTNVVRHLISSLYRL
jgi:hypothetical protein